MFCGRLNQSGILDEFGNAGNHFAFDESSMETISCSKVLEDDRILLGGFYSMSPIPCIIMLDPSGNLDPSFNEGGVHRLLGHTFAITDILTYPTATGFNILICGYEQEGNSYMIMLNHNGGFENSFGTDGVYELPGVGAAMFSIAIDADNDFVYTCGFNPGTGYMFVTKHDLLSGEPILGFGSGGALLIEPFGDAQEFHPRAVLLEPEGDRISIFGVGQLSG